MFKVKLSSNFFISLTAIVALGVVGCGGSGSSNNGTGGHGGTAGSAGKGTGGTGAVGGGAGGGKGGSGGSVGGSGGGTGGAGGGTGGVGGGTGGGTGGSGATGGAGGTPVNRCGEVTVCTVGAFRCNSGAPQTCVADPTAGPMMGCPLWTTTSGQPDTCSANQTCDATSGTCKCNNDPACGTPPTAGDFCPTQGGATHSSCNLGADGCYTVTAGTACTTGMTCQTATAGAVVPAGTACGCTPPAQDQTGKTVALNGTGCSMADATAGTRVGSAKDDAILTCKSTGAGGCYTWQITTSCTSQQLTGGTDPVTSLPACVCKTPTVANQYYVDPDPEMSTFMTGQPTGAQFPAACRFRTLTTAFAQKGVTEVIAQHTTSSNVHFKTRIGSPGVSNCNAPNSCEVFPMDIPAGVHVYTSDQGSFNPLHYVIDVDATSAAGYAVKLNDKAFLEGYTVDASGTNGSGVNAGTNVIAVVSSPITGAWTSTQAAAPITGHLNQVLILSKTTGAGNGTTPASTTNQTALLIQGQAAWQADFLSIVGSAGTGRGIVLDHATDAFAGTTASLVATHLNVNLSGGTSQVDVELGTNGANNGVAGTGNLAASDAGNILTVTNDSAGSGIDGAASLTPHNIHVGPGGVGLHVFNGTATTTSLDVLGSSATGFTGYKVELSNSPAASGVNINQGSITGAGTTTGGIGVLANGGLVTVNGTHITGAAGWKGVSVQQPSPVASPSVVTAVASAGNVTLTGTTALPTLIDVVTPITNSSATAGIFVGSGTENGIVNTTAPAANTAVPRLTIADNTKVTNYLDGIVINNGHVSSTGTNVLSTANLRDGLQVFSSLALAGTDPNDPLARVLITGASFTNNGRAGVLVRGVVPVALDTVKITGNGTPISGSALTFPNGTGGIDVQRSQINGNTGFLVTLQNSSISGNTGCGITLSGGDGDQVGGPTGTRLCGLGTADAPGGATSPYVAGAIYGGPSNIGGKISAVVKNNHVQNNTGVGVYITEARDIDPTVTTGSDDVTEVSLQNNLVTGNLTTVPASGQEPVAGGIYFAPSDATNAACTPGTGSCTASGLNGVLSVNDIGCSDIATVSAAVSGLNVVYTKNHAATACTRIRMSSFLGNTIACNGRAQLSFGIPQRISTSASGASPDGDWDISSDGSIVGVDLTMRCSAAASPNTLAGYSANASNLGLAIPGTDLNAQNQSLINVHAYGVKWNSGTIISGADYSAALSASPQGNDNATTWGICPGGAPTTCPVALQ